MSNGKNLTKRLIKKRIMTAFEWKTFFCLESHIHLCSRHTSANPAYVIKTCVTWHAIFGARYWGFVSPKLHVSTYRNQQHCWWFHNFECRDIAFRILSCNGFSNWTNNHISLWMGFLCKETPFIKTKINRYTVKPVCNDHLYNKILYLWSIQWCVLMKTEGTNLLLLIISAFWSSSRWPLATWKSSRGQRSTPLGGRYRQVSLYLQLSDTPLVV